MIESSDGFI